MSAAHHIHVHYNIATSRRCTGLVHLLSQLTSSHRRERGAGADVKLKAVTRMDLAQNKEVYSQMS